MKMYNYGKDCFSELPKDVWAFIKDNQRDNSSLRGTKQSLLKTRFDIINPFRIRDCFAKPRNDDSFKRIKLITFLFILCSSIFASAQKVPDKTWNSSRILHEIQKLKHVGRVLYIAAHPDDENTQLIAYLANVKGVDVAYMSLTRGDGGQDLIGPEVREELGVIRTQELLMARSVDGGQQFFSRANDFGFSKTAKETFHMWDSLQVLSDIVWKIRQFKPDIIITRFSPTYTKTHGHHQASAILAQEAFDDAANPKKFPEQLKYVDTWQAKSIFWNTSYFFFQDNKFDTSGLYQTNIGIYMPLLGKSIGEMAAESRTMHKSQGFGVPAKRGDILDYYVYLKGEKPVGKDIFSVADWDWNRIKGCEDVPAMIEDAEKNFSAQDPSTAINSLEKVYRLLLQDTANYLVTSKLAELQEIITQCTGLYFEALSSKQYVSVNDSINVTLGLICPKQVKLAVIATLMIDGKQVGNTNRAMHFNPNEIKTLTLNGFIPENTNITGPYWLENDPTVGMYKVDDQQMRGLPQNPHQVYVHLSYTMGGPPLSTIYPITFEKDIPVFYKNTDPVKGEMYSLARIVPPAVVIPQEKLLVFANDKPKELIIKVKSFKKDSAEISGITSGKWELSNDGGKNYDGYALRESTGVTDSEYYFHQKLFLKGNGSEQTFSILVKPNCKTNSSYLDLSAEFNKDTASYNRSFEDINYDHIPEQLLLPKSKIKVVRIDIVTHPKLIGYINGAGDDIPASLEQIGYKVEMISPSQIATINLSKYDCIIAGVRAYNTIDRLKYDNAKLMEYVKNGGNYIVQYNNNFRLVTDSIGPYFLHPANVRTTEEDCKITFLNTDNPVLNTPNKITQKDFEGWVQERGLYYPDKWDTAHYVPILEMNDAGEAPLKGALLVTQYGKGNFVYTGLSFFRELPAGVVGAYRLMANLVELEKH